MPVTDKHPQSSDWRDCGAFWIIIFGFNISGDLPLGSAFYLTFSQDYKPLLIYGEIRCGHCYNDYNGPFPFIKSVQPVMLPVGCQAITPSGTRFSSRLQWHEWNERYRCKFLPWASCHIRKMAGCACTGNAGNAFPPSRVSDPDMHHGTCVTHVPWCMPGSLTSGFLWSRWWEKRSQHSRRTHNPQFCVSGNRPMVIKFHCKNVSIYIHIYQSPVWWTNCTGALVAQTTHNGESDCILRASTNSVRNID